MTATAAALLQAAAGQVGYVEQGGPHGNDGNLTKYGRAYGLNGYAWCSIFVWWCFAQIGVDVQQKVTGRYAGAEEAMRGFAAHGWKVVTKQPRPGDVAFFHFDGGHSGANHTGLVVDYDAGGVHTIEGNTSAGSRGSQVNGGGVFRRYRPWSTIVGFGRYPFPATSKAKPVARSAAKKYPTLRRGSTGAAVKALQHLLHLTADGDYGPKTEAAVRVFQRKHHLVPDGIAGPATLRTLGA